MQAAARNSQMQHISHTHHHTVLPEAKRGTEEAACDNNNDWSRRAENHQYVYEDASK